MAVPGAKRSAPLSWCAMSQDVKSRLPLAGRQRKAIDKLVMNIGESNEHKETNNQSTATRACST